jgi:predicted O-linked N-acetylglucosamine transferase (SPINDLY family)
MSHADLGLDCFPYGSHTTASDALWGGLPIVALAGDTFASRVSSSILAAAGLRDLVTTSFDEYRELALRLATERIALAKLRSRVRDCRDTSALFDTAAFTRHLEAAFSTIWDRHVAGLPAAPV